MPRKKTTRSTQPPKRKGRSATSQKPKKVDVSTVGTSYRVLRVGGRQVVIRGDLPEEEASELIGFYNLSGDSKLASARKIIQDQIIEPVSAPNGLVAAAIDTSQDLLHGYATLDVPHRTEIAWLIRDITDYLGDPTRKRPLNSLMLAAPGAGKSHFINQLANKMKEQRVQAVTFNMATMQSHDDIAQPVDELRNVKVNDRFPLLFLDEFDSDPANYAMLLPLLWDGELHIGHRNLKLGKAVIVLAGSNPDLPKIMDHSGRMRSDGESDSQGFKATGKLVDLLSRINGGVINIPDLDLHTEARDRRVDKVCVAVSLLKGRFGESLAEVPRSLLQFIAQTTFRYGVRSIAHLVDTLSSKALTEGKLKSQSLSLPFGSEKALRDSSFRLGSVLI